MAANIAHIDENNIDGTACSEKEMNKSLHECLSDNNTQETKMQKTLDLIQDAALSIAA